MRLDKWLQTSRLVKRRSLAKEICDGGRVQVAGRGAKASTDVSPGDLVCVDYGWRRLTVRVLDVAAHPRPKAVTAEMYAVVEEQRPARQPDGGAPQGVGDADPGMQAPPSGVEPPREPGGAEGGRGDGGE